MSQKFQTNQYVKWDHAGNTAKGQVKKAYTRRVTKEIDGTEVTRDGSEEEPAYLIEQEDGDEVLKSESELQDA